MGASPGAALTKSEHAFDWGMSLPRLALRDLMCVGRRGGSLRAWGTRFADEIGPRLPFAGGHDLPPIRILEELLAFSQAHLREFFERAQALLALFWRQIIVAAQGFFHLRAILIRKLVEGFLLFLEPKFDKVVESIECFLAFVLRERSPLSNASLQPGQAFGRHVGYRIRAHS